MMDVLQESAAGLDVHKESVVACVLRGPPTGPVQREVKTFGTTTRALLELREWLGVRLFCDHGAPVRGRRWSWGRRSQ
jgi:transposase